MIGEMAPALTCELLLLRAPNGRKGSAVEGFDWCGPVGSLHSSSATKLADHNIARRCLTPFLEADRPTGGERRLAASSDGAFASCRAALVQQSEAWHT